MQDLLLMLEKDEFYKELLASIPEDQQREFVLEIEKMASSLNQICSDFESFMQQEGAADQFVDIVGSAINRGTFSGNNGVTEIPWPEKS